VHPFSLDEIGTAVAQAETMGRQGKDLVVMGSGELAQSLMRSNLIDSYVLLIHPLVLESGRRLFPNGGTFTALQLVDTKTTTNGVVITTYWPHEPTTGEDHQLHMMLEVAKMSHIWEPSFVAKNRWIDIIKGTF